MSNIRISNNVIVKGNVVIIDGEELPPAPCEGSTVTVVKNKVYIDGYEFKNGAWKRTLKALQYKWF